MSQFAPFAIALRLSGVTLPQAELETALKQLTVRYEPEDAEASFYAQVDVSVTNPVRSLLDFAERSGPAIAAMLDDRRIGKAVLDIAFDYPEHGEAMSARLPAHVAAAIGGYDIDIEVSVYLTDVEDDEED
ncbi:hypothetical protein [Devosia psychrophila]|jgi:hypothetical protein|uniref:Uncharacterized protein n=1 Tax=Devosia psychrophila TaxID=728005 RepID=A0A0F5PZ81_9HYPH|nr:hypothetical protein [Devosia psychrophila]KKC33987.1 hypothetical protein WH91_05405 [Devosia psychrophila]SFD40353.1 hypothetical protein SAMN04488059_1534 [Devosia psychrophila]